MAIVKIVLTDDDDTETVKITTELDAPVNDENITGSQMLAMQIIKFLESANEQQTISDEEKETK